MPSPGWDLDKTLNLSGLFGTFTEPDDLFFFGADGQGQAIRLQATVTDRLLHLTGTSSDPCCQYDRFKVDAWAHQLPWADFNDNGHIDADDYSIWRQSFGSIVDPGTNGDANGDGYVDAIDYTVWRDQMGESDPGLTSGGPVPEPTSLTLFAIVSVASTVVKTRRLRS